MNKNKNHQKKTKGDGHLRTKSHDRKDGDWVPQLRHGEGNNYYLFKKKLQIKLEKEYGDAARFFDDMEYWEPDEVNAPYEGGMISNQSTPRPFKILIVF